jgi:catechol-2,3-dioxygenase
MFKVLKLGHVEFEVQDLARMTDYYREVMGLTVTERTAEAAYLSTVVDHHSVVLKQGAGETWLSKIAFQIAPLEARDVVHHPESRGARAEIRTANQPSIAEVVRTSNPDGVAI